MRRRPAEWLPDGGAALVIGTVVFGAGGLAFVPDDAGAPGFTVDAEALEGVGPPAGGFSLPDALVGKQLITVHATEAAYVLRIDPAHRRELLAELDPIQGVLDASPGAGGGVPAAADDDEPDDPPPTAAERAGLAVGSLPSLWLALTIDAEPRLARHIDGMSMLVELALAGLIDAPAADALAVAVRRSGRPVLDGAAERIARRPPYATPHGTAWRLGAYVRALRPPDRRELVVDRLREAIDTRVAPDVRTALLVWLVKQDQILGRVASTAVSGDDPHRRRRLRRWSPALLAGSDRDARLRAYRVLTALVIQPVPSGTFG